MELSGGYILKVLAVYDNGGKTFDRFTVYYDEIESSHNGVEMYYCVSMSENSFHQCGGMHGSGKLGKHNGKEISFGDLPDKCKEVVRQDLN
jgi:hypothetical protein